MEERKTIIVDKLLVDPMTGGVDGGALVGYRVAFSRDSYNYSVCFDIAPSRIKSFLKMVGDINVAPGHDIFVTIEGDNFVVGDNDDIIEISTKEQADKVIKEYFYNTDEEVDDVLNSIEKRNGRVVAPAGSICTLDGTTYGKYPRIKKAYNGLVAQARSLGDFGSLSVDEFSDSSSGEFKISLHVPDRVSSLKAFYGFCKGMSYGSVIVRCSGSKSFTFDFSKESGGSLLGKVKEALGNRDDSLEVHDSITGETVIAEINANGECEVSYSKALPGYYEEDKSSKEALAKEYKLY